MPRARRPPSESSEDSDDYEQAEAVRTKTPPAKRWRVADAVKKKKKEKEKKKHKAGKEARPEQAMQAAMPWPYGYPWPYMPQMAAPVVQQRRSNIFTPPGPSLAPEAAPTIPTLHAVLTGDVQMLTPRGALLRLSDRSQVRYLDGLLRRRPDEAAQQVGARCFVKVVRIEAGMVIVDTQNVDQEAGKDLDPQHEKAEVEEWLDVPLPLVGRVIGRKGERIREVCEASGADLRFDEAVSTLEMGGNTKRKTTGGAGDDMRKFLEAQQEDAEGEEVKIGEDPPEGADDLRAFLAEAQTQPEPAPELEDEEVQEAAGDLAAFLREAKADGERAEMPPVRSFVPAVEFIAYSLENWDELLYRKMGDAGVSLVYPENLSITDKEGQAVDIEKGLRQKHFPIRVRYILTSDTFVKATEAQAVEKEGAEKLEVEAAEEGKNTKPSKQSANRKDAIILTGCQNKSRQELKEVFKSKNLPLPLTLDHLSASECLCVFQDVQDAQIATSALEGHPRLGIRMATMAEIRQKAFNRFKQPPKEEFMRLRINGDPLDVRKAKKMVLDLLDELTSNKPQKRWGGEGAVEECLSVPVGRIGHLIGKAGKNIQDLEKLTGARLRVLPQEKDAEEQQLLISGTEKAVDLAKQHMCKYIPGMVAADPNASGVPERPKRQRAEPDEEPDEEPEDLHSKRARAAEVLEAAGKVKKVKEEARRSETPPVERVKRLRERKQGISLEEYQIMLRKQKDLDAAAAKAEEAAESARAFARKVAEEERTEEADTFDWEEDKGPSSLGRLAVTSFGAGRVCRVVCTPQNQRYLTFELLAGGFLQVPEARALPWLAHVENSLGSRVSAPKLWDSESPAPPGNASWTVAEVLPQGRRLAFRLVTIAELFPRFVEATQLETWPRLESVVYLVELCTTPDTVGHIMPFRHDYRKSEKSYAKGDLLVLEGARPGLQDVGVVRKVLYGAKGEKAAHIAAQKDPLNPSGTPRLAFQRAAGEKQKREEIQALERMVLPLLAARLPSGASALGAGASLDGTFVRFFVRLPPAAERAESPLQQQAAAAAAGVGALLGCLTEVFASFGAAPVPEAAPDAVKKKAKDAKAKRKAREKAKKKALEMKATSTSSSSSSSSSFLLAMAKRGDRALSRVVQAEVRAEQSAQDAEAT